MASDNKIVGKLDYTLFRGISSSQNFHAYMQQREKFQCYLHSEKTLLALKTHSNSEISTKVQTFKVTEGRKVIVAAENVPGSLTFASGPHTLLCVAVFVRFLLLSSRFFSMTFAPTPRGCDFAVTVFVVFCLGTLA